MTTSLFLRSYARGERVYLAMLSRGYRGTMPQARVLAFAPADAAVLGLLAALVLLRVLAGSP
jgi:cobalt/nickel transport system permease protein